MLRHAKSQPVLFSMQKARVEMIKKEVKAIKAYLEKYVLDLTHLNAYFK